MLVLDASALVALLLSADGVRTSWRDRLVDDEVHAPHLIDAEFGNVLRRLVRTGRLTPQVSRLLLGFSPLFIDVRHAHTGLVEVAWSLRDNLTFYDALYVALATGLSAPLVTADARLTRTAGLPCRVELLPADPHRDRHRHRDGGITNL